MASSLRNIVSGISISPENFFTDVQAVSCSVLVNPLCSFNFNSIWLFGDGNYSLENSPVHTYKWPGVYTVTHYAFLRSTLPLVTDRNLYLLTNNLNAIFLEENLETVTHTASVSASFPITDRITKKNLPNEITQSEKTSEPFSFEIVSRGSKIPSVNLFAENSNSIPYEVLDKKWIHLSPTWRFENENGQLQSTFYPNTSDLTQIIWENGNFRYQSYGSEISAGSLVGLSGEVRYYYIDESPSINESFQKTLVTLHHTFNSFEIEDIRDERFPNGIPSYANSLIHFEHNISVNQKLPTKLEITSTGNLPLPKNMWKDGLYPYVITMTDSNGEIIKHLPISNNYGLSSQIFRDIPNYSDYTLESSAAYFKRYDDDNLPVGGYYRGWLIPLSAQNNLTFVASAEIYYPSLNEFIYYFGVPTLSSSYDFTASSDDYFIKTQTNKLTALNFSYGISVADGIVGFTNPEDEKFSVYDASTGNISSVELQSLFPSLSNQNIFPVGVAADENKNFYVSLHEAVSVLKFDQWGNLLNSFVPSIPNVWLSADNLVYGGSNLVKPTGVDTDHLNNVWVTYSNPVCSFISKFDSAGVELFTVGLAENSCPTSIVCDSTGNVWLSETSFIGTLSGNLKKLNSAGTQLSSFSVFRPFSLTLDLNENPWVVNNSTFVGTLSNDIFTNFSISTVSNWNESGISTVLDGLSVDIYNRILALNKFENKIHVIGSNDKSYQLFEANSDGNDWSQAFGDFTGIQWLKKYDSSSMSQLTGFQTLSLNGSSLQFSVLSSNSIEIYKKNENFAFGDYFKTLCLMPVLNESGLLQEFIKSSFGNNENFHDEIGKVFYEKISNFVQNNADVHLCELRSFYDILTKTGQTFNINQTEFPSELRRLTNLLSIKLNYLKGAKTWGGNIFLSSNNLTNIVGQELDVNTYALSAGTPVILKDNFSFFYEKIDPTPLDGLSSYSVDRLSAYGFTVPVSSFYSLYEYKNPTTSIYDDGVIDWDNPYTTVSPEISSAYDWKGDEKTIDLLLDYTLRRLLGLL